MVVVIPMAGFGERFRRAGYEVPKPLIDVDGAPMAVHVARLFPGADRIVFVANQDHLDNPAWAMAETLRARVPGCEVVGVPSHRRGPVHTVLEASAVVDPDAELVLAMCDLNFPWDFAHFRRWVEATGSEGCVVSYRGFHPHLLHSVHYAWLQHDGIRATAIQEKETWSGDPVANGEFCSNGVYWFDTGARGLEYLRRVHQQPELAIEGEHYVSQAFQPMIADGRRVTIYEVGHYYQWGNPRDLHEYQFHRRGFALRARQPARRPARPGTLLIPAAGLGSRFAKEGIATPKPLVPVCDQPMLVCAARDLPAMARQVFVLRQDLPGLDQVHAALEEGFAGHTAVVLEEATDGQAVTVALGLDRGEVDPDAAVVVGTCDNGVLFGEAEHDRLLAEADVLVWGFVGHPAAASNPHHFGWIDADGDGRVVGLAVKRVLRDPASDPIVIGTVTFKRAADLRRCCQRLFDRDGRVNGELYLDSAIEDALALGLDVRLMPVQHYDGWGTPDEWRTFTYWQHVFHMDPTHPYDVRRDPRVPAASADALAAAFTVLRPPLPEAR